MVKEREGGKVKRILEQQNFLFTFLSFRFFIFHLPLITLRKVVKRRAINR